MTHHAALRGALRSPSARHRSEMSRSARNRIRSAAFLGARCSHCSTDPGYLYVMHRFAVGCETCASISRKAGSKRPESRASSCNPFNTFVTFRKNCGTVGHGGCGLVSHRAQEILSRGTGDGSCSRIATKTRQRRNVGVFIQIVDEVD